MKKETETPTSKLLAKELVARILNDTDCKTPLSTAYKIVASLELEGFLAPELPEPDHDTRDQKWREEYEEEYGYAAPDVWCVNPWLSIGVFPKENEITVWDGGEKLEPFSIEEAHSFALKMLAAEAYAKENQ